MKKYLKKKAKFNTLDAEMLSLDTNTALSLIQSEDNRLALSEAILYNDYCSFGGIYKETNSTADDNTLFAVEFYADNILSDNLNLII